MATRLLEIATSLVDKREKNAEMLRQNAAMNRNLPWDEDAATKRATSTSHSTSSEVDSVQLSALQKQIEELRANTRRDSKLIAGAINGLKEKVRQPVDVSKDPNAATKSDLEALAASVASLANSKQIPQVVSAIPSWVKVALAAIVASGGTAGVASVLWPDTPVQPAVIDSEPSGSLLQYLQDEGYHIGTESSEGGHADG